MNKRQITITDIIDIKGGSILELCQYALEKGISIPSNSDYVLSLSKMESIAPIIMMQNYAKVPPELMSLNQ